MGSEEQAAHPSRPRGRRSAQQLRTEARLYLVQLVIGLVLAGVNLVGGTRDGIAWLLGGAGLLLAVVASVMWWRRRREAQLLEE